MNVISFYGSHNSAIAFSINNEVKKIIEVERFANVKNAGLAQYKVLPNPIVVLKSIVSWIQKEYNIERFDICLYQNTDIRHDEKIYKLEKLIPAKNYFPTSHHSSHGAGCFYQSPFNDAIVFSFDGGGNDGMFNVYKANRKTGLELLEAVLNPTEKKPHIYYDLGFPYMIFGHYLGDIKQEPLSEGNLVYPGKIMGLASYGKVNEEWLPHFKNFYKKRVDGITYLQHLKKLEEEIGIIFDSNNRLLGQVAYDIAATSQRAFEDCFIEIAKPYMDKYPTLPVCVTGGCALNIILNTRLVNDFNLQVFVGPNPNDCGIAVGALLDFLKPEQSVDLTYSGLPLLDSHTLSEYITDYKTFDLSENKYTNQSWTATLDVVLKDLSEGKLIGVIQGNSEHGARALGNRSIICNPFLENMKDVLNAKVKNREWYRPFAPVVRLEDVNKYFEWNTESRWMSFCPKVREEWKDQLKAITHVDGTARVQTVTQEQNPWLYNLLTEFDKVSGVGVLLNTSFNVNGKPILNTVKDAFILFKNTSLDCLLIENTYVRK